MMHASILFRVSSFHLRAHQWWSVPLFFCLLPPQQGELKKSVHSPSLYLHSMSLLPKMSEESNGLFLLQLPFLPHGFIVLFRFFGVGDQANVSKERKQQRRRGSGLFTSWVVTHTPLPSRQGGTLTSYLPRRCLMRVLMDSIPSNLYVYPIIICIRKWSITNSQWISISSSIHYYSITQTYA